MRNFYKIMTGADVVPIMNNLQGRPDLWNQHTLRQDYPDSPHAEVDDIWLRFNDINESPESAYNNLESINYPAIYELPQAKAQIMGIMSRVGGERLGRCVITRLAPGKAITAHADTEICAEYYDRYHFVLQGLPGSIFRSEDEVVTMLTGEVWWVDNTVEHEVINNSADDRIHIIIDLKVFR